MRHGSKPHASSDLGDSASGPCGVPKSLRKSVADRTPIRRSASRVAAPLAAVLGRGLASLRDLLA